jgi:CBS domain-containing protein
MGKVADLLDIKGHAVHVIPSASTVFQAVQEMVSHNVGSLLVVDGQDIRGIVTERDYLRDIVLRGRTSRETTVAEIMTSEVVCVSPGDSIEACMVIMTEKRIRHLPVLDGGRLAGIISIGDVVKQLSRDQKAEIRYLTDYITGKYPA